MIKIIVVIVCFFGVVYIYMVVEVLESVVKVKGWDVKVEI